MLRAPIVPTMAHDPSQPFRLRLTPERPAEWRANATPTLRQRNTRRAITRENRVASIAASDARWVLAAQAATSLEGGQAAIMPPESRAKLARLATQLGLRPFDANLIIAIVQDSARTGEQSDVPGLGPSVEPRLLLVKPAEPAKRRIPAASIIASIALAGVIFGMMLMWVLSG